MFLPVSFCSALKTTDSVIRLQAIGLFSVVGGALGGLELMIGQHLTRLGVFLSTCGSVNCGLKKMSPLPQYPSSPREVSRYFG